MTLQDDEGTLSKVNGQCLKIFLEPNKESEDLDEIDLTGPIGPCPPLCAASFHPRYL
jgi:hypothetical protein